ncbi:AMP-binding protein [Streptomyces sp. NBC_00876]|uniref:AMP-binding protein n=1 Tax=Streptomyces sp. NBC_00876 TaxID=2975853 RepID=UPI00386DA8FE|nr:AMP-binding protein [Streptomyces sp. NBC_00876]
MTAHPHHDAETLTALLTAEGELVTERLDHWAATTPDRTFLHYGEDDVTYTYAQFAAATDAIAGNLAAHGVSKGERVSVFSTNPLAATLLMFGVWKAGAVYAPVNFSFTGSLLTYQIDDTAPRLLVTDPGLLPTVNAVADQLTHVPTLVLYTPPAGAHDHMERPEPVAPRFPTLPWDALTAPADRPDVTVAFDDPANIVYTSGTTGPAKGVVQPYRWMAQYTYNLRLPLSSQDVIYNDLPMYHVGGAIANVARAAWAGCEVALWDRFSPTAFWSRIAARGATTAILLDVMIPWLVKAPTSERDRANTLNKVHMQPLPLQHHEVATRFGIDFVTAGFGQTESGAPLGLFIEEVPEGEGTPAELYRGLPRAEIVSRVRASGTALLRGPEITRKAVMGVPTPFVEVAVLDEHDRPCPVGRAGQLAVRPRLPALIMDQYLGKPDTTIAAWRNLWFHTGDSVVLQPDGMFDFAGRLGDRIRVRGENLSAFQVEDLLNQHDRVQLTAAFAIPGGEGDEDDIVAYVVPIEGSTLNAEEIRAFAEETMPKYMRPRHIRVVPDIPRTPTNKIEKYKLRSQLLDEIGDSGTGS